MKQHLFHPQDIHFQISIFGIFSFMIHHIFKRPYAAFSDYRMGIILSGLYNSQNNGGLNSHIEIDVPKALNTKGYYGNL